MFASRSLGAFIRGLAGAAAALLLVLLLRQYTPMTGIGEQAILTLSVRVYVLLCSFVVIASAIETWQRDPV